MDNAHDSNAHEQERFERKVNFLHRSHSTASQTQAVSDEQLEEINQKYKGPPTIAQGGASYFLRLYGRLADYCRKLLQNKSFYGLRALMQFTRTCQLVHYRPTNS